MAAAGSQARGARFSGVESDAESFRPLMTPSTRPQYVVNNRKLYLYIDRGDFVLDNVQLAWVFGQSRPPDDEERLRVVEAQRRRRRVAAPELPEAEDVVLVRVADDR